MFGSSGYVAQPKSIVQSFVHRADYDSSKYPKLLEHYKILEWTKGHYSDWQKHIINTRLILQSLLLLYIFFKVLCIIYILIMTRFKVDNVEIHNVSIEGTTDNLSYRKYPNKPPLLLNHYYIQVNSNTYIKFYI